MTMVKEMRYHLFMDSHYCTFSSHACAAHLANTDSATG